jgi:hypothetical protein
VYLWPERITLNLLDYCFTVPTTPLHGLGSFKKGSVPVYKMTHFYRLGIKILPVTSHEKQVALNIVCPHWCTLLCSYLKSWSGWFIYGGPSFSGDAREQRDIPPPRQIFALLQLWALSPDSPFPMILIIISFWPLVLTSAPCSSGSH